jgi:hypothetical protein
MHQVMSICIVVDGPAPADIWKNGIVRKFSGAGPSASSFFRARSVCVKKVSFNTIPTAKEKMYNTSARNASFQTL